MGLLEDDVTNRAGVFVRRIFMMMGCGYGVEADETDEEETGNPVAPSPHLRDVAKMREGKNERPGGASHALIMNALPCQMQLVLVYGAIDGQAWTGKFRRSLALPNLSTQALTRKRA